MANPPNVMISYSHDSDELLTRCNGKVPSISLRTEQTRSAHEQQQNAHAQGLLARWFAIAKLS